MARVSVIMPAFNSEALIGQALDSVFSQTYDDWEVVVVDDASTDRSADVAAGFGDRVKVIRSAANAGAATSRNIALESAGGELIALLDADDYWLPGFLEAHVGALDRATAAGVKAGLVTGDARVLTPDGFAPGTYRDIHPLDDSLTLDRLLAGNPIYGSVVIARVALNEAGRFDPRAGAEDYDLWIRIMEQGYRIVTVPEALAVYRRWPGATTWSQMMGARHQRVTLERAIERGRLTPTQARIARRWRRYSQAVEALMAVVEPGPQRAAARRRLPAELPRIVFVGLSHPELWSTWIKGLRDRLRGSPAR